MEVICDTNIWFQWTGVPKSNPRLIATFNSLLELGSSPKLYNDPLKIKRAAKVLLKHSDEIILVDSLAYIASIDNGNFKPNTERGESILSELENISQLEDEAIENFVLNEKQLLSDQVFDFRQDILESTEKINDDILPEIREKIQSKSSKKKHRKTNFTNETHSLIKKFVCKWSPHFLGGDLGVVESKIRLVLKSKITKLPPPAPPYTGGESSI